MEEITIIARSIPLPEGAITARVTFAKNAAGRWGLSNEIDSSVRFEDGAEVSGDLRGRVILGLAWSLKSEADARKAASAVQV
jgi:hypothetical protein